MYKKIIVLIICLFILTGCSTVYNVTILSDKNVKETIEIKEYKELIKYYDMTDKEYFIFLKNKFKNEYDSLYSLDKVSTQGKHVIGHYSKTSTIDSFKKDNIFKMVFGKKDYIDKKVVYSDMQDVFGSATFDEYYTGESLVINVYSDYILKGTNANKKNFLLGKYTWTFNKNDPKATITYELSDTKNYLAMFFNNKNSLIVGLLVLLIIFTCLFYVLFNRFKRVNSI
ncbi:MAG: hypothetical protein RR984_03235 [Bacilli bacterium]